MTERNHHSIREAIRGRIVAGEWSPDAVMPGEADLAQEYGCSRTTVNRALQRLADDGLIERKRRAGTRVKELPVRQAKFRIAIIRHEIEEAGAVYRPHVILHETVNTPDHVLTRLRLKKGAPVLHLQTVHLSDETPHAFEDRWINLEAVPDILDAPLDRISANEWLVRETPYTSGDVIFSAENAAAPVTEALGVLEGAALFAIDRTTWFEDQRVTCMKLFYRHGYKLRTQL